LKLIKRSFLLSPALFTKAPSETTFLLVFKSGTISKSMPYAYYLSLALTFGRKNIQIAHHMKLYPCLIIKELHSQTVF
jgi:hypothetical protein